MTRDITCGGCTGSLTCGGGGVANVCGASCAVSCPHEYTCNGQGICVGGNPAQLNLDLRPVTVSGKVTLNGATPQLTYCYRDAATVTITETTLGTTDTTLIPCSTKDFSFSFQVMPGTYSVSVSQQRLSEWNLPQGTFVAIPELKVTGPTSNVEAALRPVTVSGKVTLNGTTPQQSASCDDDAATVTFTETTHGTTATTLIPCSAKDFSFSLQVVPGTYRVSVSKHRPDDTNLPSGTFVAIPKLKVTGPMSNVEAALRPVTVSGKVTLNGATPQQSASCDDVAAFVTFTETTHGKTDTTYIPCNAKDFSFSLQVMPGTYRVSVSEHRPDDTNLPSGTFVATPELKVTGPTSNVEAALRPVTVSGKVTLNGATPQQSASCDDVTASVSFTETTYGTTATTFIPCSAKDFSFSIQVMPGTYSVSVSKYQPDNSNLPFGSFTVAQRIAIP
ncbi:hypothetical protein F0U60_48715 [Archangium minus]|uniref:Lipoprotein n=1 Tax=Archangium minus TaxID=83450 RepID=A0ABY9X6X4_9BACT|nr:hypothetical protein F0U60_48715 [Archangium minus]